VNCDASGEAVSVVLERNVTVRLVRLARVMVKRSWEVFRVVTVTQLVALPVLLVGLETLLFKDSEPLLLNRAPLLLQKAIRLSFLSLG